MLNKAFHRLFVNDVKVKKDYPAILAQMASYDVLSTGFSQTFADAIVAYIEGLSKTAPSGRLMIGTKSIDNGSEEIYVEYDATDDKTQFVRFIPPNNISGGVYSAAMDIKTRLVLSHKDSNSGNGCEATWIAVLQYLSTISSVTSSTLSELVSAFDSENGLDHTTICNLLAKLYRECLDSMDSSWDLNVPGSIEEPPLNLVDEFGINSGRIGPSEGKILIGKPFVFCPTKNKSSIETEAPTPGDYAFVPWTTKREDRTPEEIERIPVFQKGQFICRAEVKQILNCITLSRSLGLPPQRHISAIGLFGPASVGKTMLGRFIAYVLQLPYYSEEFNAFSDNESTFGQINPVLDATISSGLSKEDEKIYNAIKDGVVDYEAVANMLGLPSEETINRMPSKAYKKITGERNQSITEKEVLNLRNQVIDTEVSRIQEKAFDIVASDNGSVGYTFTESNLVKAMKYGGVCALDEITTVLQQGLLAKLHDAFEPSSSREVRLAHESFTVHPDFIGIITANTGYRENKELEHAFKTRLQYTWVIKPLEEDEVFTRLTGQMPYIKDSTILKDAADLFVATEDACRQCELGEPAFRQLTNCVDMYALYGLSPEEAFDHGLSGFNYEPEEREQLFDMVSSCAWFSRPTIEMQKPIAN